MRNAFPVKFIGTAVVLLGTAVLLFWAGDLFPTRPWARSLHAISPKTALCFILSGAALLLPERISGRSRIARSGFGAAVLFLSLITLLQQAWQLYPAPGPWSLLFNVLPQGTEFSRSANMSAMAAVGFSFYGIALILLNYVWKRKVWFSIHLCLTLSFAIALIAVMVYLTGVSLLLDGEFSVDGQMSWLTALALLMQSIGLYLIAIRTEPVLAYYVAREDRKIVMVSAFLLLTTTLVAGLAGAGVLLHHSYGVLGQTLKHALDSKSLVFQNAVKDAQGEAVWMAGLVDNMQPHGISTLLPMMSARYPDLGEKETHRLVAIQILDAKGRTMVATGAPPHSGNVRIPLRRPENAWLVWHDGWILESHIKRRAASGDKGEIIVHLRLHRLDRLLQKKLDLGETGALVVCGPFDSDTMQCLSALPRPDARYIPTRLDQKPLPISLALQGREGIEVTYDYYGENVISAYGPVGDLGLGMAQKIGTQELYAPLRERFWGAIGILLLLTVAGTVVLWRVVRPLVSRLMDTRTHLLTVLNSIPEGVITTDAQGIVETANPATVEIFGYPAEELLRRDVGMLVVDPRRGGQCTLTDLVGMQKGARGQRELTGRRKDGTTFPMELTITGFNLEGRQRFVGIVRDITERRAAEEALHRSEEMFRALVENSPDVIIRIDRQRRRVYANPALEWVTGIPREQVVGKVHKESGLADRISLDWYRAIDMVFATGKEAVVGFALERPDGKRHLHARLVPEFGRDGSLQFVLAVGRDITAIKRAEEILRENEMRLRGITSHVPGMVFQMLRNGHEGGVTFTYVSEGAVELCGVEPERVQADAEAFLRLICFDDRPGFDRSLEFSAKNLTPWNWEGRVLVGGYGEKWISLRATPRQQEGDAVLWDGILLNITQSKRNEQELRQSREFLRDLAAHHEAVREEERKHIAREIHDELGQVLTALKMEVSLMGMSFAGGNPGMQEKVQILKGMINSTIQTVRHVATSLRPAALDLGITSAIEWLADEFGRRGGVKCALHIHDEIELDDSRATGIFRILQESLTNVARHAQASRVEITLQRREQVLYLEIKDDGKGFDPEAVKSRASFGLRGITERVLMMGGEVNIDSRPGQGTMLCVCIPIAQQPENLKLVI